MRGSSVLYICFYAIVVVDNGGFSRCKATGAGGHQQATSAKVVPGQATQEGAGVPVDIRDPSVDADPWGKPVLMNYTHRYSSAAWNEHTLWRNQSGLPCLLQADGVCVRVAMETPWTATVNISNPLPEYPRPQLVRPTWLSLNGIWQLDIREGLEEESSPPFGKELPLRVVVPFPVEAPLSGIGRVGSGAAVLWYRREFAVPADWKSEGMQLLLNFGAVDWDATVYVNGKELGRHRGGYDKFSVDVTSAVASAGAGPHELLLRVTDPTEFAHIPVGKQRLHPPRHPSSIFYTSSSGIWQTVWLEQVPEAHVTHVVAKTLEPGLVAVTVRGSPAAAGRAVHVSALVNGTLVASGRGHVAPPDASHVAPKASDVASGAALVEALDEASMAPASILLNISDFRLWSPDDPFLYDLDVALQGEAERAPGDRVRSYFGMRTIELKRVGSSGKLRPVLNGEFLFQIGMLDQGYWPDGLYTAPADEALVFDIQLAKAMGFNLLRKHVKVEPDRWYFHADRLGMLVWQDMPAMFWEQHTPHDIPQAVQDQFELELVRMIQEHEGFPSIIAYVVFNEGWGQYDTERVVQVAAAVDPSRLYDCASGWTDYPVGSFLDWHVYVGPDSPVPTASRAAVLGEFGGLGLNVVNHSWIPDEAFSYEMQPSAFALQKRYLGLVEALKKLMVGENTSLSAAVYTELSDVEAEINGLCTYDRQVVKVDPKVLAKAHNSLVKLSKIINDPSVKLVYRQVPSRKGLYGFSGVLSGAVACFAVGLAIVLTYFYVISHELRFDNMRRLRCSAHA